MLPQGLKAQKVVTCIYNKVIYVYIYMKQCRMVIVRNESNNKICYVVEY